MIEKLRQALIRILAGKMTVVMNVEVHGGIVVDTDHGALIHEATIMLNRPAKWAIFVRKSTKRALINKYTFDSTPRWWWEMMEDLDE